MFSKNCSLLWSISEVFAGTASSTCSSEREQRLLGWLLSGLLQATPWVGRFGQEGLGGSRNLMVHVTPCSQRWLLHCIAPAVVCHTTYWYLSLETDVFEPQETTLLWIFLPFPFFVCFTLWVWSTFDRIWLDGTQTCYTGQAFEEMRAFLMCLVVSGSLREWQFPLMSWTPNI